MSLNENLISLDDSEVDLDNTVDLGEQTPENNADEDKTPSYEAVTLSGECDPAYNKLLKSSKANYAHTNPVVHDSDEILESEVISLFKAYVNNNCCWGSAKSEGIVVKRFQHENSYHVEIVSYTEGREVCYKTRSYNGGYVDDMTQGQPPNPATYPIQYPPIFTETTIDMIVPHTESVQICSKCNGNGRLVCRDCRNGYKPCPFCLFSNIGNHPNPSPHGGYNPYNPYPPPPPPPPHGGGYNPYPPPPPPPYNPYPPPPNICRTCMGSKKIVCNTCKGSGINVCKSCNGSGRLIQYMELKVIFHNERANRVIDETNLDEEKIKEAEGIVLLNVKDAKLQKFTWSNHIIINNTANEMIDKIDDNIMRKKVRLLGQKIKIRMIPVVHIKTQYNYDIFCYGTNKEIFSPNYPDTCCCGCTIL